MVTIALAMDAPARTRSPTAPRDAADTASPRAERAADPEDQNERSTFGRPVDRDHCVRRALVIDSAQCWHHHYRKGSVDASDEPGSHHCGYLDHDRAPDITVVLAYALNDDAGRPNKFSTPANAAS